MFVSPRFIRFAFVAVLLMSLLGVAVAHAQTPTTLNVYVDADTNITDWLSNTVAPGFEAANPKWKLNVVIARGIAMKDIITRTRAAKQTGSDPQVDVIEGRDPSGFTDATDAARLSAKLSQHDTPN